ncbi:CDP-alcohol phosphatidyltransferase family protein [Arenimonas sp.]|uniref:CDP-alcohol phosphatidyltransferase family protein n=1 Tax=Arenimonas sp. TaxID=1872635 RepID=UPI0025C6CDA2|nr:CDP-alcohol phosphatidyltransferase family protein [Arenimonas sp.]
MVEAPRPDARRPLATRDAGWARGLAAALARARVSPDLISAISIPVAVAGAAALLWLPAPWGPVLCAVAVQLRLLCNLLDGMVAVEGGLGGPTGPLWNEVPDRVADSLFIVALGMAAGEPVLGWAGALLAALTAYVRTTGGALGFAQDFSGVQSKPRRMFVMTIGCLVAAAAPGWDDAARALDVAAWTIAVGSALTCLTRLQGLARQLRERAAATRDGA